MEGDIVTRRLWPIATFRLVTCAGLKYRNQSIALPELNFVAVPQCFCSSFCLGVVSARQFGPSNDFARSIYLECTILLHGMLLPNSGTDPDRLAQLLQVHLSHAHAIIDQTSPGDHPGEPARSAIAGSCANLEGVRTPNDLRGNIIASLITRTPQAFIGHRSIANTVVYALVADRTWRTQRRLVLSCDPALKRVA